ncbi:J domain-containing protein [Rhodoferax sp. BLA1]|uniref:J domain-containing protein n=1 Tax=Rhodoferax sp. BLA1 TaxID=2576062 RepID=UPI0015D3DD4A|nr:J domain-containing protein [Rhodoferax sp. BLA1]
MTSFYETLEVNPRASHVVIRAAYRCLAQQHHPDKNADSEDARQRMTNINRAYAVLSDRLKRQAYDLSQSIPQDFCERRGLDSAATTQVKPRDKRPATARPFAFRPLI